MLLNKLNAQILRFIKFYKIKGIQINEFQLKKLEISMIKLRN